MFIKKTDKVTRFLAVVGIFLVSVGNLGFVLGRYGKSILLINTAFYLLVVSFLVFLIREKLNKHE